jgi:excisionase family DNA binding protein
MSKETFTTQEAATELGVTVGRVRQMIVAGQLKTERFGRAHVITRAAIEVARQRQTKPGPSPKAQPTKTTRSLNAAFKQATESERRPAKRKVSVRQPRGR